MICVFFVLWWANLLYLFAVIMMMAIVSGSGGSFFVIFCELEYSFLKRLLDCVLCDRKYYFVLQNGCRHCSSNITLQ